jgi:cyclophilin family peptidyl-prolyl cis-trans isomerase
VTVAPRKADGSLSLAVIDRDGRTLAELSVIPGEMNLLALVPSLRDADRTVWVQLMDGDQPVGAPLWVTPMRAPPAVRTVTSIRASNQQPYARVVGWGDRAMDPADPETAQAMPAWRPPDPVVTGGYRVTPARDAVLRTSHGQMRVMLAPDAAPATVDNFLRLAEAGFYDGTPFHRVVPLDRDGQPFVIQGGDPTGTGDGGPGWNLALEPSDLRHDRGVLGMARGDDPHSAGSQFYVALSRQGTARLDGQYCTFGTLASGWDTLDAIASTPIGDAATGRPKDPPLIERVELVPASPRTPGAPARAAGPDTPVTPSSSVPAR